VDARHIFCRRDRSHRPAVWARSLAQRRQRRDGSCRARSRRGGKPPGGLAVARERLPAVIRIPCLAAAGGRDRVLPGAGARGQPTNAWPQQDPSRRALPWRDTRAAGVMSSRALRRTATPGLRTRDADGCEGQECRSVEAPGPEPSWRRARGDPARSLSPRCRLRCMLSASTTPKPLGRPGGWAGRRSRFTPVSSGLVR
jgi:hypothetical protein